ncbi:uncharacterized protein TNCV_4195001 [Trichonephila clavipes]|nr:uncharacterized protein TNCV_4195001 [Trichonephila clavipes]
MQDDVCHIDRNVMTALSMYVRNIKLTDLWSLENLGISNPTLEESKQNSYEDALDDFQQKLTILPYGRFRLYPIGLSADTKKAFLMLSVHPKDRDYLRLFYPSKKELVYRHC